jgi:hypothetical protein
MNITQDFVKGIIKDGYDYLFETYDPLPEVSSLIFGKETRATGGAWKRNSVINSGTWRKTGEGEGYQPTNVIEGYEVCARKFRFSDAHVFTKEALEDMEKVKDMGKDIAQGWGVTAKETSEEFYALPFNNGGLTAGHWSFNGTPESKSWSDASGDLAYDSIPFFNLANAKRSSKGGGTYYNGFALDLNYENLKTIKTHGMANNNRRENDTRFNLSFDTLLVPPNLEDTASEVLSSTLAPYVSTNTKNVLQGKLNIVTWSYLTDTNAFFVLKAKNGIDKIYDKEPEIDFFADKKNRCWWYTAEKPIGFIMYNWRFMLGSNFATA